MGIFHCLYQLIQLVIFDALPHAQGKEPTLPQDALKPRFEAIVAKADARWGMKGFTHWLVSFSEGVSNFESLGSIFDGK